MPRRPLPTADQKVQRPRSASSLRWPRRGRPRKSPEGATTELLRQRARFHALDSHNLQLSKGALYEMTPLSYLYQAQRITREEWEAGCFYAEESRFVTQLMLPELHMRLSSWDVTGVRSSPQKPTPTCTFSARTVRRIRWLCLANAELKALTPSLVSAMRLLTLEPWACPQGMQRFVAQHGPLLREGLRLLQALRQRRPNKRTKVCADHEKNPSEETNRHAPERRQ